MRAIERQRLSEHMARLANGDRAAFDPVFNQLWPVLRRFSIRLLGDEAAGEDVAQQALLKLFARAHEYDAERDALTWALGVATWECRTWRRKRGRRREHLGSSLTAEREPTDPAVDPERATIDRDLGRALEAAIEGLGPVDRDVLLADLGERGGPTTAARPATIRKRRQRAVQRLRAAWKGIHGTD